MGFEEAYSYVRKKRPVIFPNYGFQKQLVEYEKVLKKRFEGKKEKGGMGERKDGKLEVRFKDPMSQSPFVKHTKLSIYDKTNEMKMSPQVISKQIKPKQFHYP